MLASCEAAESAEIVLFPGVRYERGRENDQSDQRKANSHRGEPELES